MDEVAKETGKTVPQIALNWLLQRPTVSSIIIGARNEEQLRQIQVIGWNLTRIKSPVWTRQARFRCPIAVFTVRALPNRIRPRFEFSALRPVHDSGTFYRAPNLPRENKVEGQKDSRGQ